MIRPPKDKEVRVRGVAREDADVDAGRGGRRQDAIGVQAEGGRTRERRRLPSTEGCHSSAGSQGARLYAPGSYTLITREMHSLPVTIFDLMAERDRPHEREEAKERIGEGEGRARDAHRGLLACALEKGTID